MDAYQRFVYENRSLYTSLPLQNSGITGGAGTPMAILTSFSTTNCAFMMTSERPFSPVLIKALVTAAGSSTTSGHYVLAVDSANRFSSIVGAVSNTHRVMPRWPEPEIVDHITNGGFASAASWTPTADISIGAGVATYTHSTGLGILTQNEAAMSNRAVLQAGGFYELKFTISSPTGTGLTSLAVSTGFSSETISLPIVSGAAVAGLHIIRFKAANTIAAQDLVIGGTSNAAASFALDNISLRKASSTARAFQGNITLAAEGDTRHVSQGPIKVLASPCYAVNEEFYFDFTPGASSLVAATIPASSAHKNPVPMAPVAVPAGGSLILHVFNVANATTPPSFQFECTFFEG